MARQETFERETVRGMGNLGDLFKGQTEMFEAVHRQIQALISETANLRRELEETRRLLEEYRLGRGGSGSVN